MHDLVHDLAVSVAGDECLQVVLKQNTNQQFKSELRHVSAEFCMKNSSWEAPSSFLKAKQLRSAFVSFERSDDNLHNLERMISSFTRLRYLKLRTIRVPDCIGKLISLRYLDLSWCYWLKCLPHSITKLWNLQTLLLRGTNLSTLPKGFSKLVNLSHLDRFVVGESSGVDALADMNLKGALQIYTRKWRDHSIAEAKRANLKGKQGLTKLILSFYPYSKEVTGDGVTLFLESLQPPLSLKVLDISRHNGERPACWMGMSSLLPNLVEVFISCMAWQFLPMFSELQCLKKLVLCNVRNVEYVESGGKIDSTGSCSSATFFPSLEYLELSAMPKLKGWWRVEDEQNHQNLHLLPIFPRLSELVILDCPMLRPMPVAPRLGSLIVSRIQVKLLNELVMTMEKNAAAAYVSELKELSVIGFDGLGSLLSSKFSSLEKLSIEGLPDYEQSTISTVSTSTLTKLESLSIRDFPNLTILPEFSSHLPKLKKLQVRGCPKLTTLPDSLCHLTDLTLWKGSPQFGDLLLCLPILERLEIRTFPTLTALPESIGHLSQLRILEIHNCPKLSVLPDSFRNLTALQHLRILYSPDLSKRCEEPHGEYWPLIQHIAQIEIANRRA